MQHTVLATEYHPNINWDFILYLEGKEPNVSYLKTTYEKAIKMTYAASGLFGNPQVTRIHAKINFLPSPPKTLWVRGIIN